MTKNTEPYETKKKEVTFYRLVNCTPSFLEFDKKASLLETVRQCETTSEHFLIVEEDDDDET